MISNSELLLDELFLLEALEIDPCAISSVERHSQKAYDFSFSYISDGYNSRGWLPLIVIRRTNWTRLAHLSDYPEMVASGDWSGIRDSSRDKIWTMFFNLLNL